MIIALSLFSSGIPLLMIQDAGEKEVYAEYIQICKSPDGPKSLIYVVEHIYKEEHSVLRRACITKVHWVMEINWKIMQLVNQRTF